MPPLVTTGVNTRIHEVQEKFGGIAATIPTANWMTGSPPSPRPTAAKKDLSGLKATLEAARVQCGIPGMSIAIHHKGEIVFAEGFGKRNESQPFTKEMDWDTTPVNKYLPEFELKDPALTSQLTLEDLLSHRTRIPRSLENSWMRSREPRRDLIKRLRHITVDDMPSKLTSKCNYSNVMYAVAGEAAANVAGTSYEQVIHDKIFAPLGLSNTGFSQSVLKTLPNHAAPYYADSLENAQKGVIQEGEYDDIYMAVSPAGDIHSNVLDLLRWGGCVKDGGKLDGKQVLERENIEMTLTPKSIMAAKNRGADFALSLTYGLGWGLDTYKGHVYYNHSGGYPGYAAHLSIFPDDDLDWFDTAVKETREAYEADAEERQGDLPERVEGKPSVLEQKEFVGEFEHPVHGRVTVVVVVPEERDEAKEEKNGEEELEFRYNELKSILEHYHFESFKAVLKDMGDVLSVLVTFQTGSDGHVSGVVVGFEEPICFTKVKKVTVQEPTVATAAADKEE
ncbi:MAG: beta-lactamase/transpeptidase-like protein [Linnemannia gamsii]|nr:MAG: beta-lactamase/transpeptidase-like protein [Linnemannia gamsii]